MDVGAVRIQPHPSVEGFLAAAQSRLGRDEVRNSLIMGLAENLRLGRRYGDALPLLLTLERDGQVVGAGLQTPPWHLTLSPLDAEACDALVGWLRREWSHPTGVNAEAGTARRIVDAYVPGSGLEARIDDHMRLFEVRRVVPAPDPGGRMRAVTEADHPVVSEWLLAFHYEATPNSPAPPSVDPLLRSGKMWLWVDAAERPVALAARNREMPHGASIGPVYTPPAHRGHGYATALVAALSQAILDEGKDYACLFTDLSNPTSNAIYPRVGYRPVADVDNWAFRQA